MKKWIFIFMVCVLSIPLIALAQSDEPAGLKEFSTMTEDVYDALVNILPLKITTVRAKKTKGVAPKEDEDKLKELQNKAKGWVVVLYHQEKCPYSEKCISALTKKYSKQTSFVSRLREKGVSFYELTLSRENDQWNNSFYSKYVAGNWSNNEKRDRVVVPILFLFKDGIIIKEIVGSGQDACSENSRGLQELENALLQNL